MAAPLLQAQIDIDAPVTKVWALVSDLTRMPQVFKVNQVDKMGFCITCHLERDISRDCSVCHY